jgi:sugar phosphate permease
MDYARVEDDELRAQVGSRVAVFSLTWLAYAAYYLGRKSFARR